LPGRSAGRIVFFVAGAGASAIDGGDGHAALTPAPCARHFADVVPAFAAQCTFVSTNGNDADPCNLAAPCRAFAASRVVKAGFRGIGAGSNVVGGAVDAVLDDVLVSEAQVQGVVGFALASGSNSTIVRNTSFGVVLGGGAIYTRGNNTIRGNNGADLTSQTSGTITLLAGS
jgi:hypothetical protein